MIEDYLILLPVINRPDLVDTCYESIDVDKKQHLMLVDNSYDHLFGKYKDQCQYVRSTRNLGCAASWNLALKRGCEWTIALSSAVKFNSGISKFVEKLPTNPDYNFAILTINGIAPGWHCVALRKSFVDMVGYMDENYYPAYHEDVDLGYRIILAREIFHNPMISVEIEVPTAENRGFNNAGRCGVREESADNSRRLFAYYAAKWGGPAGSETFKTPFNSGKPISYWDFDNPLAPDFSKVIQFEKH